MRGKSQPQEYGVASTRQADHKRLQAGVVRAAAVTLPSLLVVAGVPDATATGAGQGHGAGRGNAWLASA